MMSTSKRPARVAFRSKPVTRRPAQPKQRDSELWVPTGPFQFLDLPSELRIEILKFALRYVRRHHKIINLLLVCQQVFHEVASIYYKDTIVDLTHAPASVENLEQVLSSVSGSKLSLWRHVNSLIIKLYLADHLYLLPGFFSSALQDMAQSWNLMRLRIQIESKFPSDDFFGAATTSNGDSADDDDDSESTETYVARNGVSDLWKYHHLITGSTKRAKGNEPEIYAPLFVSTRPFQDFLRFLYLNKIPAFSLHVDSHDHHPFWCIVHKDAPRAKTPLSSSCGAENSPNSHIEVDYKELIRIYGGARLP